MRLKPWSLRATGSPDAFCEAGGVAFVVDFGLGFASALGCGDAGCCAVELWVGLLALLVDVESPPSPPPPVPAAIAMAAPATPASAARATSAGQRRRGAAVVGRGVCGAVGLRGGRGAGAATAVGAS